MVAAGAPAQLGAARIGVQLCDDLRKVNSSRFLLLRRNVGGRIDQNDDLVRHLFILQVEDAV